MEKINKQPSPFSRLELLIGEEAVASFSCKTVLVLGLGGVGGYVAEALARSGIGKLILVDDDVIDITNINRQLIALHSTIGKKKVELWKQRIYDINPNCEVCIIDSFITAENGELLFHYPIDFFVDACDTVGTKKYVLKKCLALKIPFLSCMGTAKKVDPSKLQIEDLRNTYNDPLARILRKFVKDERITGKIPVLFSTEVAVPIKQLGSTAFVPSSAGLLIASYVIRSLLPKKQ